MIDKSHEPLPTALPSIPNSRYDSIPNHSSALALLEALSDENRTFKDQQAGLQSELGKLSRISQGLYEENASLRMLHKERTRDISRLLSTITINTSEALVDYQHQQFLLHELNCGILKQIKLLAAEIKSRSDTIEQQQTSIQDAENARLSLQQQTVGKLRVKLQGGLSRRVVSEQRNAQLKEMERLNSLSNEVATLAISNKSLTSEIEGYRSTRSNFDGLALQKAEWENKVKYLKAEIQKYMLQVNNDQSALDRLSQEIKTKQQRNKAASNALADEVRKYEKYQRANQQFLGDREALLAKIAESQRGFASAQVRIEKVKEQKAEAIARIRAAKERLRELAFTHTGRIQAIETKTEEAVAILRATNRKNQQDSGQEISRLKKQRSRVEENIENLQSEVVGLQDKINTYNQLMADIENPSQELERIELMNRLRRR